MVVGVNGVTMIRLLVLAHVEEESTSKHEPVQIHGKSQVSLFLVRVKKRPYYILIRPL